MSIGTEILRHKERIDNAQQLMLDGQLEPQDYRDVKNRYTKLIEGLEKKLREIKEVDEELYEMVEFSGNLFRNLPEFFTNADLKAKQQIVGSIFPERLVFEEKQNLFAKWWGALLLVRVRRFLPRDRLLP